MDIIKTLATFVDTRKGNKCDYDKSYGYQCNDLTRLWLKTIGRPQYAKLGDNGVILIAKNPTRYLIAPLGWVKNSPKNYPKPGDVVIFNQPSLTGHIAVVVSADVNKLTIFEQNAGRGSTTGTGSDACRLRTTDYKAVAGRITI